MAKLAALVVLLIAVAAASSVSARRGSSSCEMEMEEMMPMEHCMMWMKGKMRSFAANPGRFREEHLEKCCDELMEFSSPCRCDAVMGMMMGMQQYGQMEEMERMACSLPSKCGMTECRRCTRRVAA